MFHNPTDFVVKGFRIIVRFDLASEFPEALVLLLILNLAAWWLLGRLSRRSRLRHRPGASIAPAPYMARPATAV
jgi:hypothetical protein